LEKTDPSLTAGRHGLSAEVLEGIIRRIEMQRLKKGGLGGGFTLWGKSYQASVRWRIGNVVHGFIVASVLSGLDVARIEVDVQKVRQGLHIASIDIGLGGSAKAKRIQVQPKVRSGGERDQSS
jgi:hypothetical protein